MSTPARTKATAEELRSALKDQPLISHKGAAELLGILPQNIRRLEDRRVMPKPIPVKGAARTRVYVRSEIAELAKKLRQERKA